MFENLKRRLRKTISIILATAGIVSYNPNVLASSTEYEKEINNITKLEEKANPIHGATIFDELQIQVVDETRDLNQLVEEKGWDSKVYDRLMQIYNDIDINYDRNKEYFGFEQTNEEYKKEIYDALKNDVSFFEISVEGDENSEYLKRNSAIAINEPLWDGTSKIVIDQDVSNGVVMHEIKHTHQDLYTYAHTSNIVILSSNINRMLMEGQADYEKYKIGKKEDISNYQNTYTSYKYEVNIYSKLLTLLRGRFGRRFIKN